MQTRKIYLKLHGDIAERFLQVKEFLGLKNDSEVLRVVIREFWRKELQEKKQGGEKT